MSWYWRGDPPAQPERRADGGLLPSVPPVWVSSRESRRDQLQRRLTAVAGGWVPTARSVREELAALAPDDPAPESGCSGPRSAVTPPPVPDAWEDAGPAAAPRRVERSVLPAVLFVVAGAVLGAVVLWLLAWPRGVAVTPGAPGGWPTSGPATAEAAATVAASGSATASSLVVVDVAGAVHRPGVFELPAGSRVIDALDAAGGPLPRADTTPLNLARLLADGEQVLVPRRGASPVGAATPPVPGSSTAPAQLDLNTATFEQLDGLPGIGPVLAQRILDWRTANGGFASIDQLQEVSGIGEATFADLAPLVRV